MRTDLGFPSGNILVDFEEDQVFCCGVTSLTVDQVNPNGGKSQKDVMRELHTFLTKGYRPTTSRLTATGRNLLRSVEEDSSDFEKRESLEEYYMRVSMFVLTGTRATNLTQQFARVNELTPLLRRKNPKTGNMINLYGFTTYSGR